METTIPIKRNDPTQFGISAKKFALWAGIASICMFFVGLTSALVVKKAAEVASGTWLNFEIPYWFYSSTAVIYTSSITFLLAKYYLKKANKMAYQNLLLVTTLLGFAFLFCQYEGWVRLREIGIYLGGGMSHSSGAFFYVISGAHAVHIVGGLIYLMVCTFRAYWKPLDKQNIEGLEMAGIYWHFVDILWIYLFALLIF